MLINRQQRILNTAAKALSFVAMPAPLFLLLAVVLIVMLPVSFAAATLGESLETPAAVNAEKAKLRSTNHRLDVAALYSVHVMDSGLTTVREYTNADGVVFAVTWKGVSAPDLKSLFGSYYGEYLSADQARVKTMGHRQVAMKSARLSIHRGGHMGALRGSAVIATLVPAGVNAEELP